MTRIAITGTPGTGKTQIAKNFSKITGIDLIHIEPLLKKAKTGYDKKRGSDIIDPGVLSRQIRKINKKDFIIESHLSHLIDKELIDVCVVLVAEPEEIRKRLGKRGWKKGKIEENVLAEQMKICYGEAMEKGHETMVYNTTGKTPKQSAKQIAERIC